MLHLALRPRQALVLGVTLALVVIPGSGAIAAGDEASPTVHELMERMSTDLETVNRELLRSDYPAAAAAASRIAGHPMVKPAQRAAIAKALGEEMADFKGYDTRVHEAATALDEAARARDDAAIARHLGEVVGGCISCHSRFRNRVRDALEAP